MCALWFRRAPYALNHGLGGEPQLSIDPQILFLPTWGRGVRCHGEEEHASDPAEQRGQVGLTDGALFDLRDATIEALGGAR